jgi:hypothetical protein
VLRRLLPLLGSAQRFDISFTDAEKADLVAFETLQLRRALREALTCRKPGTKEIRPDVNRFTGHRH